MARYIEFVHKGYASHAKTARWEVVNKRHGTRLGIIAWFTPWRQYCFSPWPGTVFNQECLDDIARFIEEQMKTHRATVTARRLIRRA